MLAFEAGDADAHVRLGDHVYVVGAVADGQGYGGGDGAANELDDLGFLFGGDSAGED